VPETVVGSFISFKILIFKAKCIWVLKLEALSLCDVGGGGGGVHTTENSCLNIHSDQNHYDCQ
jgi:hypothetical protein